MNVQELIDELTKVKDKTREVVKYADYDYFRILLVDGDPEYGYVVLK